MEVLRWLELVRQRGNDHYAAFVALAAARCEQALSNTTKQALHLTQAGTQPSLAHSLCCALCNIVI